MGRFGLIARWLLLMLPCFGGVAVIHAQAPAPPPPLPEAELIEFYEATDGDNWFRNEGWLDPEVEVCDWYGIECRVDSETGEETVTGVVLPDNNLTGELATGSAFDSDIFSVPADAIDLSGNRLSGALERIPFHLEQVNLSRNRFSGPLPSARAGVIIGTPPPDFFSRLDTMDLSRNRFEGVIPEDWDRFQIANLDLSNNQLDGGAENAFAAIGADGGNRLSLADNRFFGPLSPEVANTRLTTAFRALNLCWNDFQIDDAGLAEWIGENHIGGDNWESCLNRGRLGVDPTVSGSWYVPQRSGEGVSLQLLEGGGALLYSFTFDLDGRQLWMFEVGRVFDRHLDWELLWETRGDFGEGLRVFDGNRAMRPPGRGLRIDRLEDRLMQFERQFMDFRACPPLEDPPGPFFPCPVWQLSDRFDNTQLTRLAGTTCDNQDPNQWISGAWFDPDRSGEGFIVEIIEDGRAVVYWFTYGPDDSGLQVWMTGVGDVGIPPPTIPPQPRANLLVRVDDLVLPIGGVWGAEFDRDQIERVPWGTLTLEFFDDDSGHVSWNSVFEDFGAGDHPLTRLARPMLAECPDD